MRAATREALRVLDTDSRTAAYKLSVLATPLPPSRVAALLVVDPAGWPAIEGALIDNHLFLPGNPPWFHEQRRLLLRQQIPNDAVVPYLQGAAEQLSALAQTADVSPDTLIHYADITDSLVRLDAADPTVSAVGQLGDDALAVLGAVIELTDGSSQGVDGEQALLYARRAFRSSGDLPAALTRLSEAGFVATASNEYATVVVASFGSVEAWLYTVGRIGSRLGRMALPRIASLVFNTRLRGALGPLASAVYGVGDPSLGELARQSVELQVRPPNTQQVRPGRKGPSLLVSGKFGDIPFYAAVAYEDSQDRDNALSEVQALSGEPVFGRSVEVTLAAPQPNAPLPTRRLIRAFERGLGISIGNVYSISPVKVQGEQIASQDAARQRVTALNLLAELSDARERQVTGHSAARYGLLWWAAQAGDAELTAVVANADGVISVALVPTTTLHRLDRVELVQLAGLDPDQIVGFTQFRARQQHTDMQPVVDEVVRHAGNIAAYNCHQPRRRVAADLDSLQVLIQEQLDHREATAQTVAESFGRTMPDGHDLYLLIDPDVHTPGRIPGAGRQARVIQAPMRGSSPHLRIAVSPPPEAAAPPPAQAGGDSVVARWTALLADVFAVTDVTPTTRSWTTMLDAVAKLLGHMSNEIWLVDVGRAVAAGDPP